MKVIEIDVGRRFGRYVVRRHNANPWEKPVYCDDIGEVIENIGNMSNGYAHAVVYAPLRRTALNALRLAGITLHS